MATIQEIQAVLAQNAELLRSRVEQAKQLRENQRLLRSALMDAVATDGAAYRREVAVALAEIKLDSKALNDELKSWEDSGEALEKALIQSLAMTNEKHVAYADLGTLSVVNKGYWQVESDVDNPDVKAAAEKAFFDFVAQEVRVGALTMRDALDLRENRFSAGNLEETIALYAEQNIVVPGVKKVVKSTISFRKAV